MKKLLKKFRSLQTRYGFYSVGMIAIVIVIAVVINLIVGQLPEKFRQVDVSNKNIYGISWNTISSLRYMQTNHLQTRESKHSWNDIPH